MHTFLRLANNLKKYKKFNQYYTEIWLQAVITVLAHRAPIDNNKPIQASINN